MLRFFFINILFIGFTAALCAQNYTNQTRSNQQSYGQNQQDNQQEGTPKKKKKKLPYPDKERGLSIGVDVSRFLVPVLDNDRIAFEANLKTNYKKRMFLAGSLGFESVSFEDESTNTPPKDGKPYSYESTGIYGRVGFDYDIFVVEEENNNDNILFGFRYGFATQEHGADQITISDDHWGYYTTSISTYSVTTHWLELVSGLRTELFNNLYLNLYVRLKTKLASNNSKVMEPYRIPGFGRGSNNISLGFSYVVEYQIPWGNKKRGH